MRTVGCNGVPVSEIRLGISLRSMGSRAQLTDVVQRAEQAGLDLVAAGDHLGAASPFLTLVAAGAVSGRLRLRTYVLDVGFHHPALLAREVATADVFTGGRLEVGLGAGHMKSEHEEAGLGWPSLAERVDQLERTVVSLRRRLEDPAHRPRPVQAPVPLVVGAMSEAGLAVAARHADVVAFAGLRQIPGRPPGTFTLVGREETAQRVEQVRRQAAGRHYEPDVLLQAVVVDRPPEQAAEELVAAVPHLTVTEVLDSPFVLLAGSAEEAAEELVRRRDAFGFTSVVAHEPSLEALAAVTAVIR